MLTNQKIIDAINEQIGYEFSASMQYYAIAAHFAAEALPQLSTHFFQQAEEEKEHACALSNMWSMPVGWL
jgi:ferritin